MKYKNNGVVLIYVLLFVTLAVVFATILLNNNAYLFNISEHFNINTKLVTNIKNDAKLSIDINREYNTNGTGFIDNISCPGGTSISMSGTTLRGDIGSVLVNSGSIYCEGTYQSNSLKIFFNTGFTDFIQADYNGSVVGLNTGIGDTTFSDGDNTLIDFSGYTKSTPDLYDDNFNSDNYKVTSTGTTSTGTYYLDNFQDDDVLGRKTIHGYVDPELGFKKVFFNTTKSSDMINQNSNNGDSLNTKIGDVDSGLLYFEIDVADFDMKLVVFDKTKYDETGELIVVNSLNSSIGAGGSPVGYLQEDLTFSTNFDGITHYIFDFNTNMYALFLKSTSQYTLLYKITGRENDTLKGIYITPIDDSNDNIIRYLGNEVIINDEGLFIAKESEIIFTK